MLASKLQSREEFPRRDLASQGNDIACRYLSNQGYIVLDQNWCCEDGMVDIIAEDEGLLVFVEVRVNPITGAAIPEGNMTKSHQEYYERIALSYLKSTESEELAVRFDVITLHTKKDMLLRLNHHHMSLRAA